MPAGTISPSSASKSIAKVRVIPHGTAPRKLVSSRNACGQALGHKRMWRRQREESRDRTRASRDERSRLIRVMEAKPIQSDVPTSSRFCFSRQVWQGPG